MFIRNISLINWRNYAECSVDFDSGLNVIRGENAQGKTNLLEAVHYLAVGRGFRAGRDGDLIADSADSALSEATVATVDRDIELRAELRRGARRRLFVNGSTAKTAGEFAGRLRAVLFAPGDLELVSGAPADRRKFLDDALCQLRPRYAEALAQYTRLHKHKTRILRDGEDDPSLLGALDAFNERIARVGAVMIGYRARFVRGLSAHAPALHSDMSGGRETLGLRYQTSSRVTDPFASENTVAEELYAHLCERKQAEIASGMTLVGPHRDELAIEIDGRPSQTHASQGQTRTAALALKLAERQLFLEDSGENPVLLLDDVLSELDDARRRWVLGFTGSGQVLITLCDGGEFGEARVFTVRGGRIDN